MLATRRRLAVLCGVSLPCLLAVGWWRVQSGSTAPSAPHLEESAPGSIRQTISAASPARRSDVSAAATKASGRVRLGEPSLDASTPEHVAWLNRHHFVPVGDLNDALRDRKLLTLRDLQGPLAGLVLARAEAAALTRPDLREAALARLNSAAAEGSIGALVALERVYASRDLEDPVRADAYARVAAMRGDWGMRARSYTLDHLQDLHAGMLAEQITRGYDRDRRRRGLAPLGRDTRPGLDAQLELMPRATAEWQAALRAAEKPRPRGG